MIILGLHNNKRKGETFLGFSWDWIIGVMGDFCLGEYLQILYTAKNEDRTNTRVLFIGEILSLGPVMISVNGATC